MLYVRRSAAEVMRSLGSSENGLSEREAESRLAEYGENSLVSRPSGGFLKKLLFSFADAMTLVLFIAAAVSYAVSRMRGESAADSYIILAIVLLNGAVSAFQELKAEKALEALQTLSVPVCAVIRGGTPKKTESRLLVPGDIITVEKGSFIPADARIIKCADLRTDESALTGESGGVEKDNKPLREGRAELADMRCMLWAGTVALSGRAKAVVTATGMRTRMGGIAEMLIREKSPRTPLQERLAKLSTRLGNAALAICLVIFALSIFKGTPPADAFLNSVSLAVAAIPEGLPAIVTVMLSLGVTELARRRAVVKKLPAVETLGCATVICSDKTGTLTQNALSVTETDGDKALLARLFAMCGRNSSPTENALFEFSKHTLGEKAVSSLPPMIDEIPFDHKKRYMATLHAENGGYTAVIKGAPEAIRGFCKDFDGKAVDDMTGRGLRVIAAAYARCESRPRDMLKPRFTYAGCAGMTDPPRKGAKEAIEICRRAGIKTVMITGDHPRTAFFTARELGIAQSMDEVKTQSEIMSLPAADRESAIMRTRVFARSSPEFKVAIVRACKNAGEICAMTGDGVNDAPALKSAHIGCAMGKSGTDVAREACDMILTDDDFSTIAAAILTGRGIYENIRRAVHFLISCNIGEIFAVFAALMFSLPSPVSAVQLLWVNLVTDSLPAIALGMEKPRRELMDRPPVRPDSPLFCKSEKLLICAEGAYVGAAALAAFLYGGAECGGTMAFGVLSFTQLFHSFNVRSERPILSSGFNGALAAAFVFSAAAQLAAMVLPPLMRIFGTVPLGAKQWAAVAALSASMLAAGELSRLVSHSARRVKTKTVAKKQKT